MRPFTLARLLKIVLFAILGWFIFYLHNAASGLEKRVYLSGWCLFLLVLFLSAFNARKKIPFLPLGTARGWLQLHLYGGYLTLAVFFLHIQHYRPTGWFEGVLAVLFLLVSISGIFGHVVSRVFPKRLTARGGEVIFERIPIIRKSLREQAESLALKSIPEVKAGTVAEFYVQHLQTFFAARRHFWQHVFEVSSPLARLLKKIDDLNRYLNDTEKNLMREIALLVRQKDGLDYHESIQLLLKSWLFVHIPLTFSLLLFSALHLVLVYAFSGGAG